MWDTFLNHPVSTGLGQGQVTKDHQKHKVYSGVQHTIFGHFCTHNSKHEAILRSNPRQVNDREGSGKPRVIKIKFSNWDFRIKMRVFG